MAIDRFQGDMRWLSNFHECEIEFEFDVYPTTEHAYQASKTLVRAERLAIQACDTPKKARSLGQTVTVRPEWEEPMMGLRHPVKVEMMYRVNHQKFFEHCELGDMLLATGDQHLMEGNTWGDTFWGVCDGRGQNWLGRVLMDIREELRRKRKLKDSLEELGVMFERMYGRDILNELEKLDKKCVTTKDTAQTSCAEGDDE